MTRYIIRRLLWGVVLLILVSALLFVLFRVLPTGDPAKLRAGRLQNPKIIAEIRHDLGLDKSLLTQFWLYMKGIFLHFDLGFSYYSGASVKEPDLQPHRRRRSRWCSGGAVVWLVSGADGRDHLRAAPPLAAGPRSAWAGRSCSSRRPNTGSG